MTGNGFDPATFDPYRALGVARGATSAQIKRAHRTLAKRYHPDAATGDTARFLAVHEAYRLLSDALLRREWDDKHAPGPVRADAPPARKPRRTAAHHPRRTADADEHATPRSTHAYRWSASEVPWWEEGAAAARQRRARRTSTPKAEPHVGSQQAEPQEPAADFEVYNRSSGAAWSMAARAYFRRGDEDLPRRGQFHYEGTQVVTAGRARMAQQRAARQSATPETGASPAAKREPSAKAEAQEESGGSVLGRLRSRLRGTSR
jgi:curved DNA-binding protein CbpA